MLDHARSRAQKSVQPCLLEKVQKEPKGPYFPNFSSRSGEALS